MKTLYEYIIQTKKTYPFKVKIAGDVTVEHEMLMRSLLEKYQVLEFKKLSTTPVQTLPLDFPRLNNTHVNIWEVVLDYPVTSAELINYLGNGLRLNETYIVVRNPNEPSEHYQEPAAEYKGPLLLDNEFKESPNVNPKDYYGDEYNAKFVKELNDILKAKRVERGEKIPCEADGTTTNSLPQGTRSPIANPAKGPVVKTRNGK